MQFGRSPDALNKGNIMAVRTFHEMPAGEVLVGSLVDLQDDSIANLRFRRQEFVDSYARVDEITEDGGYFEITFETETNSFCYDFPAGHLLRVIDPETV
jgi:hypothetical protein